MKLFINALFITTLLSFFSGNAFAITSKVVKHSSLSDFAAKDSLTDNAIINSDGFITLSFACENLVKDINSVWTINTMIVNPYGIIYFGTSPNGEIYKFDGNIKKIYSTNTYSEPNTADSNTIDANTPKTAKEETIKNKHIFSINIDKNSNLLAGLSGDCAKLIRFINEKPFTIFEPNNANYIFAVKTDRQGDIYIGTGPNGKIYQLKDSKITLTANELENFKFEIGKNAEIIFDANDKSILSMEIGNDGTIYAGTDKQGIIYKINPITKKTVVLFDSDLTEITGIKVDENGNVYAAATSEEVLMAQSTSLAVAKNAGKVSNAVQQPPQGKATGTVLNLANTKTDDKQENPQRKNQIITSSQTGPASHIYKISPDGIVESVFSQAALFFAVEIFNNKLIIPTGNEAQLFTYGLDDKISAMLYQDKDASQILCAAIFKEDIYIATGNPARLYKIKNYYAGSGSYISPLIDAGQPAKWGKFQLDAEIPHNTKIKAAARTANIADTNDKLFPQWSDAIDMNSPIDLPVTAGRFMQYKLIFETKDTALTPKVSQTATAYIIPNIAPKVIMASAEIDKNKSGIFNIAYQAKDENEDTISYKIEYKNINMKNWIVIEENFDKPSYEWNSKTVEDGRYEIKITANDAKSNDTATFLVGERTTQIIVVDNTPPLIEIDSVSIDNKNAEVKFTVKDEFSAIGSVQYSINSCKDYISILPQDLIYDMTNELFEAIIKDIKQGVSVITLKASDDVGNTAYKAFEVTGN